MRKLLLLGLSLLLAGSPAQGQAVLKVGVVTSLTGPAADFGLAVRNSFQLATADRPENFRRIQFIYEDAGYDTKRAVYAFHKLVHVDKVQLIHTWGLSFCQALAPLAEAERIPLVAECLDPNASQGRPHVIRFFNYSDEVMALQAEWLKRHDYRRIGLLVADTAYLQEMTLALKRNLAADQRIVFEEHVLPSENDLRVLLNRAARSDADIIGVLLSTGQIGTFYRQREDLRIDLPTFGTNWYESVSEIEQASGLIDGAVFVSIAAKPSFAERYAMAFGNASALAFAAPAYEFAALLGELFGSLPAAPSTDAILDTFASADYRRGAALESFRYRESAAAGKYFQLPIALKTIFENRIHVLETIAPPPP